jgi:group I intron endonuclease
MKGYIYLIVSDCGLYVGQTTNPAKRWREHRCLLRSSRHDNSHFQRAWNKYGEQAFEFKIAEECSIEKITEAEQYWIDAYRAAGVVVYNTEAACDNPNLGRKPTEEHRRKISLANTGKPGPNLGRKFSREHCQKISESMKGNKSALGHSVSAEVRAKISKSLKHRSKKA